MPPLHQAGALSENQKTILFHIFHSMLLHYQYWDRIVNTSGWPMASSRDVENILTFVLSGHSFEKVKAMYRSASTGASFGSRALLNKEYNFEEFFDFADGNAISWESLLYHRLSRKIHTLMKLFLIKKRKGRNRENLQGYISNPSFQNIL